MSKRNKASILWVMDADDLAKIPAWFATRSERVTKAVVLHHDDTDAYSICLFNEDFEEGIIRCSSDDLADAAADFLPADLPLATAMGGNRGRYL